MNVGKLETALLNAARKTPSDDRVPYAFEKRIMANLPQPSKIRGFISGTSLWRAAFSCMAITLLCGLWSASAIKTNESEAFSQSFEGAVYATIDQHVEEIW